MAKHAKYRRRPLSPPRRPVHKGKAVVIILDGRQRIVGRGWLAKKLGNAKGGRNAHASGHLKGWFTSERVKAMRAKQKRDKRYRPKRQPKLDYMVLRTQHQTPTVLLDGAAIYFDPSSRQWMTTDAQGTRVLSEVQALTRLGYRKRTGRVMPTAVIREVKQGRPRKKGVRIGDNLARWFRVRGVKMTKEEEPS